MQKLSIYNDIKTRIIPGLATNHQIVSMPNWTWFWLDDFMKRNKIDNFDHMYQSLEQKLGQGYDLSNDNLTETLKHIAEIHEEYSMRQLHNLANDNGIEGPQGQHFISKILPLRNKKTKTVKKPYQLARVYKLFKFVPCATTSDAVWRRKNRVNTSRVS